MAKVKAGKTRTTTQPLYQTFRVRYLLGSYRRSKLALLKNEQCQVYIFRRIDPRNTSNHLIAGTVMYPKDGFFEYVRMLE